MSQATEAAAHRHIRVAVPGGVLGGDLVLPEDAPGSGIFAHGSGSSRFSGRNRNRKIRLAKTIVQRVREY